MSAPGIWLGISNGKWLINSNTPHPARIDRTRHGRGGHDKRRRKETITTGHNGFLTLLDDIPASPTRLPGAPDGSVTGC